MMGSRSVLSVTGSAASAVFECVMTAQAPTRHASPANSNGRWPRQTTNAVIALSARSTTGDQTHDRRGQNAGLVDRKLVNEMRSQRVAPAGRRRSIEASTLAIAV